MDGVSKAFLGLLAAEGEEVEAEEADTMATMEQLVATNQALLEALGVSHPALQQVLSPLPPPPRSSPSCKPSASPPS